MTWNTVIQKESNNERKKVLILLILHFEQCSSVIYQSLSNNYALFFTDKMLVIKFEMELDSFIRFIRILHVLNKFLHYLYQNYYKNYNTRQKLKLYTKKCNTNIFELQNYFSILHWLCIIITEVIFWFEIFNVANKLKNFANDSFRNFSIKL